VGVQTHHADPVWRYYSQPKESRVYETVKVKPSVAQAAMIGAPVSFPRVKNLVDKYEALGGRFNVVQVTEQAIMDSMILVNRFGNIACTQGGESFAGMLKAMEMGILRDDEFCILDSTAHALKFAGFQNMYFEDSFPEEYGVKARPELVNHPQLLLTAEERAAMPEADFTKAAAEAVAKAAGLAVK
jgi:threonine synthase